MHTFNVSFMCWSVYNLFALTLIAGTESNYSYIQHNAGFSQWNEQSVAHSLKDTDVNISHFGERLFIYHFDFAISLSAHRYTHILYIYTATHA